MVRWVETGLFTHGEANRVKNQLLEDYPLQDDECFDIGCYVTKGGHLMYGVQIISKAERAVARAEYEEDR